MKKNILTTLILLFSFQLIFSQEKLTENQKLTSLCKVWGFMKYYHPSVRAGEYDWDRELLCIMPSLVSLPSKEKRNEVLVKWIDQFDFKKKNGIYSLCASDSIKLLPDLDWIEDKSNLGTILSDRLKEIRDAERDTASYYVNLGVINMGNAVFEHEERYSKCTFPEIKVYDSIISHSNCP
jgi:hypothetical protein